MIYLLKIIGIKPQPIELKIHILEKRLSIIFYILKRNLKSHLIANLSKIPKITKLGYRNKNINKNSLKRKFALDI